METSLYVGPDGASRCRWCAGAPEFLDYHDREWGFPVADDHRLFEKICLESFQSGLSWRTILGKRENFRSAFHNFRIDRVAEFTSNDVERLLNDDGIVRHRGKIEAVINNAKCAQELVKRERSLAAYIWQFEAPSSGRLAPSAASTSNESVAMSKDLKKRGWKFVGPTTVYALMQAMGLVNDHAEGCVVRQAATDARDTFIRPRLRGGEAGIKSK
jgi:DNA-3-methyladenine glycosylase I